MRADKRGRGPIPLPKRKVVALFCWGSQGRVGKTKHRTPRVFVTPRIVSEHVAMRVFKLAVAALIQ
jgi:hypothetical protein